MEVQLPTNSSRSTLADETNPVEEEYRFLTQCSKYEDDRELIYSIGKLFLYVQTLENSQVKSCLYMMTPDDEIPYTVADFVRKYLP